MLTISFGIATNLLKVSENKVLRGIFYLRGKKCKKAGEDYIMRSCALHRILVG
jgi:hypothetical protein